GLFCNFCVLFANEKCGRNKGMIARNLITRPKTLLTTKYVLKAGLNILQSYHKSLLKIKTGPDRVASSVRSAVMKDSFCADSAVEVFTTRLRKLQLREK
ncbi:hypothetical protein L9F63_006514, partial [Diploptera punctata]